MAAEKITDLNDFCLIKIFKYLCNCDLMTLSLSTKRFRQLVLSHVVPQIMFDFNAGGCEAFRKIATKISYNLYRSELECFLEDMLYYCTPGLLTNIQLHYGSKPNDRQIDQDLLQRAAKYVENVKTLLCFHIGQMNEWLTSIASHQIRTLELHLNGTHDFRLSPASFPHLLNCTILIDSVCYNESYTRFNERYESVTEFIRGKSKLKEFSYRDHGFEDQMIFKMVAENCLDITSLGVLKIKSTGAANNWNFLKQCQHLEDITMTIGIFDGRKFAHIFHILSVLRSLKVLHINFEKDSEIQKEVISDEITSFLKSNNGHRKADPLNYMELFMDLDVDNDIVVQLCSLIASLFRVTTLSMVISQVMKNSTFVRSVVQNLHGLEHLSIAQDCFSGSSIPLAWSALMEDKISLNNQLNISKKLVIYVDNKCEVMLKTELVNCYDPDIISIASKSNFVLKKPKFWHW